MSQKKPIHAQTLSDLSISVLCSNYALKRVQLAFRGMTALDCSIILSLYGQGAVSVRAVSEIVLRVRRTTYNILRRCAERGLIEETGGVKKKYRLSELGLSVYAKYCEGYEIMKNNLIKLEEERLARLRR